MRNGKIVNITRKYDRATNVWSSLKKRKEHVEEFSTAERRYAYSESVLFEGRALYITPRSFLAASLFLLV